MAFISCFPQNVMRAYRPDDYCILSNISAIYIVLTVSDVLLRLHISSSFLPLSFLFSPLPLSFFAPPRLIIIPGCCSELFFSLSLRYLIRRTQLAIRRYIGNYVAAHRPASACATRTFHFARGRDDPSRDNRRALRRRDVEMSRARRPGEHHLLPVT